jgi:hypothetical protein
VQDLQNAIQFSQNHPPTQLFRLHKASHLLSLSVVGTLNTRQGPNQELGASAPTLYLAASPRMLTMRFFSIREQTPFSLEMPAWKYLPFNQHSHQTDREQK